MSTTFAMVHVAHPHFASARPVTRARIGHLHAHRARTTNHMSSMSSPMTPTSWLSGVGVAATIASRIGRALTVQDQPHGTIRARAGRESPTGWWAR